MGVEGGGWRGHDRQLRPGKNIRCNTQGRGAKRGPGATHKGDQKRRETMRARGSEAEEKHEVETKVAANQMLSFFFFLKTTKMSKKQGHQPSVECVLSRACLFVASFATSADDRVVTWNLLVVNFGQFDFKTQKKSWESAGPPTSCRFLTTPLASARLHHTIDGKYLLG